MLNIKIPGREELTLSHLILDYNGTIAEDGEIIESIQPRLAELSKDLSIYVITADTHGTAAKKCEDLPLQVLTYPTTEVGLIKAQEAQRRRHHHRQRLQRHPDVRRGGSFHLRHRKRGLLRRAAEPL